MLQVLAMTTTTLHFPTSRNSSSSPLTLGASYWEDDSEDDDEDVDIASNPTTLFDIFLQQLEYRRVHMLHAGFSIIGCTLAWICVGFCSAC